MATLLSSVLVALGNSGGVQAFGLVTKSRTVINAKPAIISATLAVKGAELPLCEGVNDLLPVTFSFPVSAMPAGDLVPPSIDPEIFEVTLLNSDEESGTVIVTPNCATLAPAAEPDELRTVLLLGSFAPEAGVGPVQARL